MNKQISNIIAKTLNSIPQKTEHHVSFKLNTDCLDTIKDCMQKFKQSYGDNMSRLSVIRMLIDIHDKASADGIDGALTIQLNADTKVWLDQPDTEKVSLLITEQQRVAIRKLEFDIQKKDWSIVIDRNDTIQLLIKNYGEHLKSSL